ncbi:A nuclease of the HNH/ENDO VII superfamily with conserved WHH [Pseudovibrio ascidiaceicola]|uniref:A nuclease of the HNH/ENDO VII superfamily with conserved WHH n=1 Tax=Pseudovibrio ascidiaceicola TaxID=285279 RepID=A0A1I4CTU7_9HYPH|nr:HNH endonuclease [Pseudovibrio ascidiaceicola]SFK84040.1 A nuclease of the HNH/ENDO VII superfamily with conserved WHH [Pseudovibrio ascidiaceicola]
MGLKPRTAALRRGGKKASEQPAVTNHMMEGKAPDVLNTSSSGAAKKATSTSPFKKYKNGEEIPWPAGKPKGEIWDPVKTTGVRKVTRVPGGMRMEMTPPPELKKRFGLKEGENVSIKYDDNGYPDFKSVRKEPGGETLDAVKAPESGDVKIDYGKDRAEDFTRANKELVDEDTELAEKAGAIKKDGKARRRKLDKKDPDDKKPVYTWHHHEDGTSMLLVDYWVHKLFGHSGGRAEHKK